MMDTSIDECEIMRRARHQLTVLPEESQSNIDWSCVTAIADKCTCSSKDGVFLLAWKQRPQMSNIDWLERRLFTV